MKQTAVDWLYKEMIKKSVNDPSNNVLYILQQAKEMEKEQIMEAHLNGQAEWDIQSLGDTQKKLSEQYYKETF